MKDKIFSVLQRVGRSFMLPIAILPVAGLLLGIGSSFTNATTIETYGLTSLLGNGTILHALLVIMNKVGSAVFDNLPLIFAVGVAIGMAKKEKEVSALSAVIAYFVMNTAINAMLTITGQILENGEIAESVLEGTITSVCGIQSLQMGVFGGIIVGLGVAALHNRFYRIQLPNALSFFGGTRFVPIISTIVYMFVGILMYFVWPVVQNGIYALGGLVTGSGYVGTLIFGLIKRALIPFGLHHVFYMPFWQTAVGGTMEVAGQMVQGGQNIFFAQLADSANVAHFSADATRYFSGEFIFMIFGLPGAALAMYQCANPEAKKKTASLLLSAALTSALTGITEPIEFSFLFVAPLLYVVHVLLAATCFVVAQALQVAIGFTFSAGLLDFTLFGILQGNAKTNWMIVVLLGLVYFFVYYGVFKFLIVKYDLKTPGRDESIKVFDKKKYDFSFDKSLIDPRSQMIVQGLGGRSNFTDLDCCITRLRATIKDDTLINEGLLKKSGAAAIMCQPNAIQIIYGPQASNIKTKLDEYMLNVPESYDFEDKEVVLETKTQLELECLVNGEVMPIEDATDSMFAHKLMGDGIMIRPCDGVVVAPCDGVISMIYPTKHAIGITIDDNTQILIHFGTDSAKLNGKGFELLVKPNQKVNAGDVLWNADLKYIKDNALDENIIVVFTKIKDGAEIEKKYGKMQCHDMMLRVKG